MSSADRKTQFFALVRRFNERGCLLPALEDFDTDGAAALAEVTMVIAEMKKARAEMDRLLDQEAAARQKAAAT